MVMSEIDHAALRAEAEALIAEPRPRSESDPFAAGIVGLCFALVIVSVFYLLAPLRYDEAKYPMAFALAVGFAVPCVMRWVLNRDRAVRVEQQYQILRRRAEGA